MTRTRGTLANQSGNILEQTVKTVFLQKKFEILPYNHWEKHRMLFGTELLLTNAPYTTIYNHPGHTEFLVLSKNYNLETRIECKWQRSAGSVDEKLPYLYLNCIESMPENQIIIILDGDGFKKGSKIWLENAVKNNKYCFAHDKKKIIEVFSLSEFIVWANKILR